eukprot:TRINITY_DN92262_c0_g1_i1.p1 TRINITY_DN92262_c0_g1~~TRINITY_DN92262_c0_g1_i1.p1  ORF type:complete len:151 (-),score=30.76 TRINITY_DN92262_c0_g1_i1:261-713(-)
MPRETQGFVVLGDRAALAYVQHVAKSYPAAVAQGVAASQQERRHGDPVAAAAGLSSGIPARPLGSTTMFCAGDEKAERWIRAKLDAFVSKNLLEPPEEQNRGQGLVDAQRGSAASGSAGAAGQPQPSGSSRGKGKGGGRGRGWKRAAPGT